MIFFNVIYKTEYRMEMQKVSIYQILKGCSKKYLRNIFRSKRLPPSYLDPKIYRLKWSLRAFSLSWPSNRIVQSQFSAPLPYLQLWLCAHYTGSRPPNHSQTYAPHLISNTANHWLPMMMNVPKFWGNTYIKIPKSKQWL